MIMAGLITMAILLFGYLVNRSAKTYRTNIWLDDVYTESGWHDEAVLDRPKRYGVKFDPTGMLVDSGRTGYHVRYRFQWQRRILDQALNDNRALTCAQIGKFKIVTTRRLTVRQWTMSISDFGPAVTIKNLWEREGYTVELKQSTGWVTVYGYRS
jgi:hypothetical protein